jgi:hypothetical protein
MWSTAIILVVLPRTKELESLVAIHLLAQPWKTLPDTVQLGVAATAIYLAGMTISAWVSSLLKLLRTATTTWIRENESNSIRDRWPQFKGVIASRLARIAQALFPADQTDGLLTTAIRNSMPDGTDATILRLLAAPIADAEISLAALKLSKELPEQYQQYDRVKAEGDSRTMMAPALAVIGIASITYIHAVLLAAAAVGVMAAIALTIAQQGHALRMEAERLIATAMYMRWTGTPTVDAISSELLRLHSRERPSSLYEEVECILRHVKAMRNPVVNQWLFSALNHPTHSGLTRGDEKVEELIQKFGHDTFQLER